MSHLHIVASNEPPRRSDNNYPWIMTGPAPPDEPSDEDLWLEEVARRVETDARPLFAAVWLELLRRALDHDENEPA